VFSLVQAREIKDSPADKEIARLNADIRRIPKKTSFGGVDVNFCDHPEAYDAYVRLSGNELKHPAWGMGAKDFLDAVVSGHHDLSEVYAMKSYGKNGGKAEWLRSQVRNYRELAQAAILDDPKFSAFKDYVDQRKQEKAAKRSPVLMMP
jgi:hypothetical protein